MWAGAPLRTPKSSTRWAWAEVVGGETERGHERTALEPFDLHWAFLMDITFMVFLQ